jgi:hypothetical protein
MQLLLLYLNGVDVDFGVAVDGVVGNVVVKLQMNVLNDDYLGKKMNSADLYYCYFAVEMQL